MRYVFITFIIQFGENECKEKITKSKFTCDMFNEKIKIVNANTNKSEIFLGISYHRCSKIFLITTILR